MKISKLLQSEWEAIIGGNVRPVEVDSRSRKAGSLKIYSSPVKYWISTASPADLIFNLPGLPAGSTISNKTTSVSKKKDIFGKR